MADTSISYLEFFSNEQIQHFWLIYKFEMNFWISESSAALHHKGGSGYFCSIGHSVTISRAFYRVQSPAGSIDLFILLQRVGNYGRVILVYRDCITSGRFCKIVNNYRDKKPVSHANAKWMLKKHIVSVLNSAY